MKPVSSVCAPALFRGWVRHRRFEPAAHAFRYPLFMFYLNLDSLEKTLSRHWFCSLERFNIVSFRRRDYFLGTECEFAGTEREAGSLKQSVITKVQDWFAEQQLARPEIDQVCVLTHLRLFTVLFNPVSFYYCFDRQEKLVAILAEITNTPWGERHAYVLPVGQPEPLMNYQLRSRSMHCFDFAKDFHVSPFNPMSMQYRWRFNEPTDRLNIHMDIHMKNRQQTADGADTRHFDATLTLQRMDLAENLAGQLIRFPLMTVSVLGGIYWQAFRLWLKRMPIYDHPDNKAALTRAPDTKMPVKEKNHDPVN